MSQAVEAFFLRDAECLPGLFIEADAPVSSSQDWIVPVGLLDAMIAGRALSIRGAISSSLERNLQSIQNIYRSWLPNAKEVAVNVTTISSEKSSNGSSVFFSGGVDSFYSLLKHRESINNLVLVQGFDIPLGNKSFFEQVRSVAEEVAALFEKRLITVKTNLRTVSHACSWGIQNGAALATVAHAIQPNHSTVYIGSSYPYKDLHIWGSHPLLDPLWSSASVQIVHDGAETDRVGKLKLICQYPEVIKYLRVCWQNTGLYNCGTCEKCLRTMIGLLGLDSLQYARFSSSVDPVRVRRTRLDDDSVLFWRDLLALDLPLSLRSAIEHAIRNHTWGLPPHGSVRRELGRLYYAARQLGRLFHALLS
jgi:hypothetical protein